MKTKIAIILGLLVAIIAGCVSPGKYDVNDVYQLQQTILENSPQDRSVEGLGLMTPKEGNMPKVKLVKDPKTGKYIARLSMRQAVMRAVANNPEIAVVSFAPQIAREEMMQAASEFDYTLFGGYNFAKQEYGKAAILTGNSMPGMGINKLYDSTFDVGVRQKTITGAQMELAASMISNKATPLTNGWDYQNNIGFNITQPLLRGAGTEVNLANLKISRLNYRITFSQFNQNVQNLVVQVMDAYYRYLQARENVRIAKTLFEVTKVTYDKVRQRRRLDATKVQIKQSETAVREREATWVRTIKLAKDAQDNLVVLLGDTQLNLVKKNLVIIPSSEMTSLPVKINTADQLLTAVRLNPSLEQARLAIRQADINVMVAKNELLPSLNLTAGVDSMGDSTGTNSGAWNGMVSGRNISYNAALTFEYPIGNRQRESQFRQSKLLRQQAVAAMQATADQIALQVRESVRQIETQYQEIRIRRQALNAAKEQLQAFDDLEKIRARLTPEFLNLKLGAQLTVAQSEQQLVEVMYEYNAAMLRLSQATGTTLEINQVQMAMPVITQPADLAEPVYLPKAPANDTPLPLPGRLLEQQTPAKPKPAKS